MSLLSAFTHRQNTPAALCVMLSLAGSTNHPIFWRFLQTERLKLAQYFQASFHVHLCLPWQKTKVEHYLRNSIDGKTRFSFLQR